MHDIGNFYYRMLPNIDLSRGETVGISIIFAWLGLLQYLESYYNSNSKKD